MKRKTPDQDVKTLIYIFVFQTEYFLGLMQDFLGKDSLIMVNPFMKSF